MRPWKAIGLVGGFILIAAISNSISRRSPAPPPDIATMKEREQALNEKCRGGSGDLPETQKACDERDQLITKLAAAGVCWGDPNDDTQSNVDMTWQRCDEPAPQKREPERAFAESEGEPNDEIQYDPLAAEKKQRLRSAISVTRGCMRGQAQVLLRGGGRDRQQFVDWLSTVCRGPLNFNSVLSPEEIAETLDTLAHESIRDIELEAAG